MISCILNAQKGDKEALNKLISENSSLIYSVARRFLGRGVELDDLYQLGSIGFIKAVNSFDESFGTQFSTYAVPKIAGEIKRFLRDDGIIKVSRGIRENAARVSAARAAFEKSEGREARISDICALTGLDSEEVAVCIEAPLTAGSLDAEIAEDFSLYDTIQADYDEQKLVEHLSLKAAIDKLDELWRKVIILRYFGGLTQQKTAEKLGLSQVQVSRIERRAIMSMRENLVSV